jgi:3-mercaptopyruvate sulfurtransferase SseA
MYFALDYLGHGSSVALLDGGLEKWSKEQGRTRNVPGNIAPAVLTVYPGSGRCSTMHRLPNGAMNSARPLKQETVGAFTPK